MWSILDLFPFVAEAVEDFCDVPRHGEQYGAIFIIPSECDAAE